MPMNDAEMVASAKTKGYTIERQKRGRVWYFTAIRRDGKRLTETAALAATMRLIDVDVLRSQAATTFGLTWWEEDANRIMAKVAEQLAR